MFTKSLGARRRRVGAVAAMAAVCAATLVTTSAVSGAEVRTQKSKIDKTAVIRMGVGVGDNGGASFGPADSRPQPHKTGGEGLLLHVPIHHPPGGQGAPPPAPEGAEPRPA